MLYDLTYIRNLKKEREFLRHREQTGGSLVLSPTVITSDYIQITNFYVVHLTLVSNMSIIAKFYKMNSAYLCQRITTFS